MPTFTDAANTIRKRFTDEFHTKEPEVPIAFDNVTGLYEASGDIVQESTDFSDNPAPWVRLNIRPGDARQVSLGPRTWRNPGVVITQVFVPTGTGDKRTQEIAVAVASSLRGVTVDGVRFEATSPPKFVGPDGGWYQTNIATPFEYDETA